MYELDFLKSDPRSACGTSGKMAETNDWDEEDRQLPAVFTYQKTWFPQIISQISLSLLVEGYTTASVDLFRQFE